jgi:predicted acylesterase/phospholipase RssA
MCLLGIVASTSIGACTLPGRLDPSPVIVADETAFAGIPNARYYADLHGKEMAAEGQRALERERAYLRRKGRDASLPTAHFLAISGGGDDGAFGAGLLVGWTARGTRPTFKIVTGISTGALAAPFAFLGPQSDAALTEVYTGITKNDIYSERSVLAAVTDDAMADNAPLYQVISRHLTAQMLREIAEQYDQGRLLFVATTYLDRAKSVIWNIGAIAKRGDANALELIRRILLASAAIPGVFPPVMFSVRVDGREFQEMHVDGGALAQAFLYPPTVSVRGASQRRRIAYLIRNGRLEPPAEVVERRTIAIAKRAIATLVSSNGVGDMYRIYSIARRDGVEFNLSYIDGDFAEPYVGPFDQGYMRTLFNYGHARGKAGNVWKHVPPQFGVATR